MTDPTAPTPAGPEAQILATSPLHPADTTPPGLITLAWLESDGACWDGQVELVAKEWGESHQMTLETLQRAMQLGCDLDWLANHLLRGAEARRVWQEATAEALWKAWQVEGR